MQYILISIQTIGQAYQEVLYGSVVRYTSLDGTTLFTSVPDGLGSEVLDGNPPQPAWALPDPVVEQPAPYVPPARRLTKLAYIGRLGPDFINVLTASKTSVEVEAFVRMLDWATPDPDGTSIDLDDPRVIYALNTLEASGVIGAGRAAEILSA